MIRKISVLGIVLFLSFVFCSVSEAKSLKKGEEFYVYEGGKPTGEIIRIIRIISSDELELELGFMGKTKDIVPGKYTVDGDRVRIVTTVFGTNEVQYYKITSNGLVAEKTGAIYYTKAALAALQEKTQKRAKEKFSFSDLTVLDKETKLMWTRDGKIAVMVDWNDAFKFVEDLNDQKYAGYSDWRLPSKEEFLTLVNFAKEQGYTENINEFFLKIVFKNLRAFNYWSSTTNASNSSNAWLVDFKNGNGYYISKSDSFFVLCVRGGR